MSPVRGALHAVILAGGAGERFWPASRQRRPKPVLEVVAGGSLLAATVARARRFAGRDRIWVVCGREHARAVREAAGVPARRLLVEPSRRNTAMAIAWAAERIAAVDPGAVLAVLPADHHIPDGAAFAAAIRRAARAAGAGGWLVTLGVTPTRPDTGYGYIQTGAPLGRAHPGLRHVRRFVEKPDAATARRFLRQGGHLWNAGIFVWSARAILQEIEVCAPQLHRALAPLRGSPRRTGRDAIARAYRRAPSLPIDAAVMERSRRVVTLPVRFRWSDVGTWASLAEELGVGPGRSRVIAGELAFDEPGGNLVWGLERPIALLGVSGLAVIDTPDALLVTRLERSPEVRRIVAALKRTGRADVT
ncbi:MAG TPA: mannose-1-phosphate guanylyltransferase [Myxococcota bacterium]|jgi:mannose-1-phosphate guanylyltransferase